MLLQKFLDVLVNRTLKLRGDAQLSVPVADVTAAAGAATLHKMAGVVTSEALTTAAGAAYTLTLTNKKIAADDVVLVSVSNGTNADGTLVVTDVTPAAGSVVVVVSNIHATDAVDGAIKISFVVVKRAD